MTRGFTPRGARPARGRPRAAVEPREAEWQTTVTHFAGYNGWRWFHPADNTPGASGHVQDVVAGFPDLVLIRGPRLVLAELKAETGRVSVEQSRWIGAFTALGGAVRFIVDIAAGADPGTVAALPETPSVEMYVWRPSDWPEVQRVLARGR